MAEWQIKRGAIVERPRDVGEHPLLAEVYDRHDELISELGVDRDSQTLEIAFGRRAHPDADVGIEAYRENTLDVEGVAVAAADARSLPFSDGTFDTVIGRRFLHHVPEADRAQIVSEAARVLLPSGRLVVIEGTPGPFRRATKGLAFGLGLLEEDNDEYGHLTVEELRTLLSANGFDVLEMRSLGSPILPLGALKSPVTAKLGGVYDRTQWVKWWTLAVGESRLKDHKTVTRDTDRMEAT